MSYLIKTDYGDLKFIVHSSGLETNFSELKNLLFFCFFFFFFFFDSVKKSELSIEKARYKEEKINRIR